MRTAGDRSRATRCGASIEWGPKPDGLTIDHLDGDKANNDLANLVPSCSADNAARGKGTLVLRLEDLGVDTTRALAHGPIKTTFPCGHLVAGNVYRSKTDHSCLTCRRRRARAYYRRAA